jgi:hypothetical protein
MGLAPLPFPLRPRRAVKPSAHYNLLTDHLCKDSLLIVQPTSGSAVHLEGKGKTMWEYEHSVETTAAPEALWRHWSDMARWPQWNAGIDAIDVAGPFAVGTSFTMTPPGQEPIRMRLVDVRPGESFTDEMDAGDFVVRTEHRLEPVKPADAGLTRIVYRMEITGQAADHIGPELGPQISADFPEVLAALAKRAEG